MASLFNLPNLTLKSTQGYVFNSNVLVESGNVGIGTTFARGRLEVNGNIIPSSCNVFDLGSESLRFRDLYMSGGTIDMEGVRIGTGVDNSSLNFSVGGETRMTITSAGNLVTSGTVSSSTGTMFRNRIINGDMRIDQRNAGAERTGAGVGGLTGSYLTYRTQPTTFYSVDRWAVSTPDIGALTAKQVNLSSSDVDALNGDFSTATSIAQVPMDDLGLYYPMNSNLTDASGNGVAFTTVGTMRYAPAGPVSDFSLYLANEGNVLATPTAAANYAYAPYTQVGNSVTVSCWMMVTKLPQAAGRYSSIWEFINSSLTTVGFYLECSYASASTANLLLSYSAVNSTTSFLINSNTWYHVVAVYIPRTSWTLYVNGTSIGSITANVPSSFNSGPSGAANTFILLGTNTPTGLNPFAGYLQDFRIYNRALSASEIAALATNVGLSQAPPTTLASGLTTRLTFDNTTADAQGTLGAPTVGGSSPTPVYNPSSKVGTASLDLTANVAGSTTAVATNLTYTVAGAALPITLACWINAHTPVSGFQIIVAFLNSGTSAGLHIAIDSSGYAYAWIYISGVVYSIGSTTSILINPGTWYHLCVTVTSGSIFNFYINGRLTNTSPLPSTAISHTSGSGAAINQFRIGSYVTSPAVHSYKGLVDDVRIYNRALSLNEVKGLYASSQYATASLFQQTLEGRYLADLGWGTAKAQTLTTSMWLKHTCSTAQQFSLSMNNSGLISWIDFEGSSVADKLGYLTNGTITGAGTYNTSIFKVGTASFNFTANTVGSAPSTYIRYNMPVALQVPFTVSFWFYATAVTGGTQGLLDASSSITMNDTYGIAIYTNSSGQVYADLTINLVTYTTTASASTAVSTNTWNHVGLTILGNVATIYVNGTGLATRTDIPIGGVTSINRAGSLVAGKIDQLILGTQSTSMSTAFKGYLDDIRIYNRALSADQVYQLYVNNANSTASSSYTMPRSVVYNTPSIPPNTWQKLTFTVPGDTTGQWMTNNDAGLTLALCMGASSLYQTGNIAAASNNTVSVWNSLPEYAGTGIQSYANSSNDFLGNIANTVFVTGVQVEKGNIATSFENRPVGMELGLCQRYYEKTYDLNTVPGTVTNAGLVSWGIIIGNRPIWTHLFKVPKRNVPILIYYNPITGAISSARNIDLATNGSLTLQYDHFGMNSVAIYWPGGSGGQNVHVHLVMDADF